MEIVKKAVISVNGKFEEIDAVIDTGGERTMIDEEVLLKIGAPKFGDIFLVTAGEYKDKKPLHAVMVEIDGCKFPVWAIGGRKNLIGHDFLQQAKAVIDEDKGTVQFKKNYIEM